MNVPGRDGDRPAKLRDRVEAFPWAQGVLTGVGTALGGYVAIFALLVATGAVDFGRSIVEILRSVGLIFYNAHNVPTFQQQRQTIEQDGGLVGEATTQVWRNAVTGWQRVQERVIVDGEVVRETARTTGTGADPALPALVYLAVPVLVLVVAGAVFTDSRVSTDADAPLSSVLSTGLFVGAAFALGYLLVALLGTYLLAVEASTPGTFLHPARLEALGYGVAYPFVAASLGAGIALGADHRDVSGESETVGRGGESQ